MRCKTVTAAAVLALAVGATPAQAQAPIEIQWWHSMSAALGEWVGDLAREYNASQSNYRIVPTYKGGYDESMTAAIAAFRSGNAPDILQVFEVGTATMMAAKGAVRPVAQIMQDAGLAFDQSKYIAAVAAYYTAPNGQMMSFPFNSSTTIFITTRTPSPKPGWTSISRPKPGRKFLPLLKPCGLPDIAAP